MNIVLVGRSCSGKTEIQKILTEYFRYEKVVTDTTREPREGERDGIDYNFVTREEFAKGLKDGKYVAPTYFGGNFYGVHKDKASGKDLQVIIVDPSGIDDIDSIFEKYKTICVCADEDVRRERMIRRGATKNEVESRMMIDEIEFAKFEDFVESELWLSGIDQIENDGDVWDAVTSVLEIVAGRE